MINHLHVENEAERDLEVERELRSSPLQDIQVHTCLDKKLSVYYLFHGLTFYFGTHVFILLHYALRDFCFNKEVLHEINMIITCQFVLI